MSSQMKPNTCCLHLRQQIRTLQDEKAKHYEEIQFLKNEIDSLNRRMLFMQKQFTPQSVTKETRCLSTQTGTEQKVDRGFTQKRPGSSMPSQTNAKRQRLVSSYDPAGFTPVLNSTPRDSPDVALPKSDGKTGKTEDRENTTQSLISSAFTTLETSCYELMPTIEGRLQTLELPGLTEEEKSVIFHFGENPASLKKFMSAILSRIKAKGAALKHELLQFLCRVYVGLCQKTGDFHKAHALSYRLLKDDFPEAPKLILLMVSAWPSVFDHTSSLCQAIHTVTRLKAEGDISFLLREYLHWDEKPPGDIHRLISCTLKALLTDNTLTFRKHSWFGVDLCPAAWEYIYSLELLCSQLGWSWTQTNIISQKIWPILSSWLRPSPRERVPREVCVAAVIRLLGRLSQLGLKKNQSTSLQNIAKALNQFGSDKLSEKAALPWEVQLSLVYTTHDLAPSNPKEALAAVKSWQKRIKHPIPPAIKSCTAQIVSLCLKSEKISKPRP